MKQVFLAGEGRNELGSWCRGREYQDDSEPGVLKTLLQKVKKDGWQVSGAIQWKSIKKYKAGDHQNGDEWNVRRACLIAKECKCSIIAFTRDSDGNTQRELDISKGLQASQKNWGAQIGIIGGCAVPCIEGWILAVLGTIGTEKLSSNKAVDSLKNAMGNEISTERMAEIITQTDIKNVAHDAIALGDWLKLAKSIL